MKKWLKNKRKTGFTIMELLIVMAVFAVVSTGGVFVASTQVKKAQDARRKEDLKQLEQALEHYYSDFGVYAPAAIVTDCGGSGLSPYLDKIPCDPRSKQAYVYVLAGDGQAYELYTNLVWESDPVIASIGCGSGCGPGGSYNYGVASGNVKVGTEVTEEGVQPECGGPGRWFCYPNVCAECCPGSNYRCNGAGDRCLLDAACGS